VGRETAVTACPLIGRWRASMNRERHELSAHWRYRVKIKSIQAMKYRSPEQPRPPSTPARRPGWIGTFRAATPMSKYPGKPAMTPREWEGVWVKVTAEDGTTGLGLTWHGDPVAAIIDHHFAPLLEGED